MSCAFRALPRLVPELLLSSPRGTEVIIVSPWIKDLMLRPPVFGTAGRWNASHQIRLSRLLEVGVQSLNLRIVLVVREIDMDVQKLVRPVVKQFPQALQLIEQEFLHAKVIATASTVLSMSANLIPTSFYRNVENCDLAANRYGSARKYVRNELRIKL